MVRSGAEGLQRGGAAGESGRQALSTGVAARLCQCRKEAAQPAILKSRLTTLGRPIMATRKGPPPKGLPPSSRAAPAALPARCTPFSAAAAAATPASPRCVSAPAFAPPPPLAPSICRTAACRASTIGSSSGCSTS